MVIFMYPTSKNNRNGASDIMDILKSGGQGETGLHMSTQKFLLIVKYFKSFWIL